MRSDAACTEQNTLHLSVGDSVVTAWRWETRQMGPISVFHSPRLAGFEADANSTRRWFPSLATRQWGRVGYSPELLRNVELWKGLVTG